MFKFGSPRLQFSRLQWVENYFLRQFLYRGNITCPKSNGEVEVVEVEAKKPDDIVDEEDSSGPKYF